MNSLSFSGFVEGIDLGHQKNFLSTASEVTTWHAAVSITALPDQAPAALHWKQCGGGVSRPFGLFAFAGRRI